LPTPCERMHCANFSASVVTLEEGTELPVNALAVVVVVDLRPFEFDNAGELDLADDVVVALDRALGTPSDADPPPHADKPKVSVTRITRDICRHRVAVSFCLTLPKYVVSTLSPVLSRRIGPRYTKVQVTAWSQP
jgi:hypothetical protein